jgi:5-methyltetrahydrofolate--homocysteine methyltransferase
MSDLLSQLAICIERGKADINSPYPPDLRGQEGANELTLKALQSGISANDILKEALMVGMRRVGDKFSKGQAFIPDLLIAAKAMKASMQHLKPYFESGEALHKGTFVLGTVKGDLHDIGKNIVRMVLEGDGWKVVDLGADVSAEKFLTAVDQYPGCMIGLSALLTTTMINMEEIIKTVRIKYPDLKIFIGGAPVTTAFSDKIKASGYFPDPQQLVNFLSQPA